MTLPNNTASGTSTGSPGTAPLTGIPPANPAPPATAATAGTVREVRDDRSLGDLLGELARETTTLVQQEVNLVKTELTRKAEKVGKDIGAIAVGGAVLYAGMLTLIASLILILAQFNILVAWAAALILGLVITVIGAVMVSKGLSDIKETDPVPHQTIQTLKEDKQWAKEQLK